MLLLFVCDTSNIDSAVEIKEEETSDFSQPLTLLPSLRNIINQKRINRGQEVKIYKLTKKDVKQHNSCYNVKRTESPHTLETPCQGITPNRRPIKNVTKVQPPPPLVSLCDENFSEHHSKTSSSMCLANDSNASCACPNNCCKPSGPSTPRYNQTTQPLFKPFLKENQPQNLSDKFQYSASASDSSNNSPSSSDELHKQIRYDSKIYKRVADGIQNLTESFLMKRVYGGGVPDWTFQLSKEIVEGIIKSRSKTLVLLVEKPKEEKEAIEGEDGEEVMGDTVGCQGRVRGDRSETIDQTCNERVESGCGLNDDCVPFRSDVQHTSCTTLDSPVPLDSSQCTPNPVTSWNSGNRSNSHLGSVSTSASLDSSLGSDSSTSHRRRNDRGHYNRASERCGTSCSCCSACSTTCSMTCLYSNTSSRSPSSCRSNSPRFPSLNSFEDQKQKSKLNRSIIKYLTSGRIVGCALLVTYSSLTGQRARVEDLIVHPDCRGRRLGLLLACSIIHLAKEEYGCVDLQLTSASSRAEAQNLYKSVGMFVRETNCFVKYL